MQQFNPGIKNSPPVIPAFWTAPNGFKVHWHMSKEHWLDFMQKINAFCDGNEFGRPPESEVENQVCAQFPKWACNGETDFSFPPAIGSAGRTGGCCGRR